MARTEEFNNGFEAHTWGAKVTDNPYPVHDLEKRRQWFAGWHAKEMLDDQRNFLCRYFPDNAEGVA